MPDVLQQVRDLQYEDEAQATALLLAFMRENLPFSIVDIALRPSAVSLNSFNGFMMVDDGKRYFFKSHTETDTVIDEYYNAEMLANAGYNVIQPVYRSEEPGKQMLIYEVISDPSVFEVAWEIENGNTSQVDELTQAQNTSDDALCQHYKQTRAWQDAADASKAPIHQLFYYRLTQGRLSRFYGTGSADDQTQARLLDGVCLLRDVRHANWVINGQHYDETLNQLEGDGRVALRYLDNPNGSARDIAGLLNESGNVLGMMPHPENAIDPLHGGTDGRNLFKSMVEAVS